MMDLSDGLAADLPRLATASHCGFTVDESSLPKTKGCTVRQALTDGEDFELLFAIAPRIGTALEAAWPQHFPRLALTRIGTLCDSQLSTLNTQLSPGHDHFA